MISSVRGIPTGTNNSVTSSLGKEWKILKMNAVKYWLPVFLVPCLLPGNSKKDT